KQAASLVKDGVSVSLERNTETEKAADNSSPFVHTMTSTGKDPLEGFYSMDLISVSYHGWAHTHMDSLCHMFYKGRMYNGFAPDDGRCGIPKVLGRSRRTRPVSTRAVRNG